MTVSTSTIDDLIAALASEVQELRDKEAIRERMHRYVFLLDTSQWRDIPSEIFTEDGVDVHLPAMGEEGVPRGRVQLAAFYDRIIPGFASSQHMLGNSVIEVDGDEAHSMTYAHCVHWESDEKPHPSDSTVVCAYDDKWRRTPDGWRVYERHLHRFGAWGLSAGKMMDFQPKFGADLYGHRDRA
jgi:SnoaL-like domain